MGAIDHDLQAIQAHTTGQGGFGIFNIAAGAVIQTGDTAHTFGRHWEIVGQQQGFNLFLGGIRQFEAVRAKELDAVVVVRVVRGRNHHTQISAHGSCQQTHSGGRQWTKGNDIQTSSRQTSGHGVLKHIARPAGVLANDNTVGFFIFLKIKADSHRKLDHIRGGHRVFIRPSAHTVGAENLSCHGIVLRTL